MRYTRYNYKKKKNNGVGKMILSFLAMSVFVIIIGVLLANVIIYFLPINDANKSQGNNSEQVQNDNTSDITAESQVSAEVNNTDQSTENVQETTNTSFMAIQCGYFSEEDNAKEVFNKISDQYGAFIYKDSEKFKVLAGVYTVEEGQAVMKQLIESGVQCYEVDFNLNTSNTVENQISGIFDGYLDILNEVFKDDVKFFDTTDFKSWVNNLENITDGDKKETLDEVKNHIKEISTEIKKEDVSEEMKYLYETLLNFNK